MSYCKHHVMGDGHPLRLPGGRNEALVGAYRYGSHELDCATPVD